MTKVARQTLPGARPNREAPVCFDYCLRVRPLEAFGNKCPRGMIASASCEFIRCEDRTRLTVLRYFFYSVSNEEFSVYFCERADIVSFTTFAILDAGNCCIFIERDFFQSAKASHVRKGDHLSYLPKRISGDPLAQIYF